MIAEALDALPDGGNVYAAIENVELATQIGDLELARRILSKAVEPGPSGRGYQAMLARAILAEAEGDAAAAHADFVEAGAYFTARGWAWYRGKALAGAGRALVALGQMEAGLEALAEARGVAETLRAAPLIARIDGSVSEALERAAAASGMVRG